MMGLSLGVAMIGAVLYAQRKHYEFLRAQKDSRDLSKLTWDLEVKLKEFDEVKKRVDSLTLRAGFKN